MLDFLIVGQGIAGSVLALQLLKHGQRILIINTKRPNSASNTSAGIYNPITGNAMVKTWQAENLFPYLTNFYREAEQTLGAKFLYSIPIFRPFLTIQERSEWMEKATTKDYSAFVEKIVGAAYHRAHMVYRYGGIVLKHSGYLDARNFLRATRTYLESQGAYVEAEFIHDQLHIGNHVSYSKIKAHRVIFCEGPQAKQNPFFNQLPFRWVKGELLWITLQQPLEIIYNRRIFVLPQANKQAIVGATYDWKDVSLRPTKASRQLLEEKLRNTFRLTYTVHKQWAGIRPATFDRKPLIGMHPQYSQVGIFNGLGTKGVSLAPYFTQVFVEHLLLQKELPPAVQLSRTESHQRA